MSQNVRKITKDQSSLNGAVWSEYFSLTAGVSDLVLLPPDQIAAIFVSTPVNGTLSYSFDSLAVLQANTSVTWIAYSTGNTLPFGATAIQFAWSSGTATCHILVKTAGLGD